MKTPSVTPAQYGTIAGALAAVIGIISQAPDRLQVPLIALVGVLGVAWILADGLGIRPGRAKLVAAQHLEAAAAIANLPVEGDDSIVPAAPIAVAARPPAPQA